MKHDLRGCFFVLLIGSLLGGCSSVRTVEPVDLDRISKDPARYHDHKVAVRGFLHMGNEGDQLCSGPGHDAGDSCVAIQRTGIFKKRRSDYVGRLNGREVTFTARLVATPVGPPASCIPNQPCVDAGHGSQFEFKVLSPVQGL